MSPEQPPGWTPTRSRRSSRPSCESRDWTLPAATSVRTTPCAAASSVPAWVVWSWSLIGVHSSCWQWPDMGPVDVDNPRGAAGVPRARQGYVAGRSAPAPSSHAAASRPPGVLPRASSAAGRPRPGDARGARGEGGHRVGDHRLDIAGRVGDGIRAGKSEAHRLPTAYEALSGDEHGGSAGLEGGGGHTGDDRTPQGAPVDLAGAGDDEVAARGGHPEAAVTQDLVHAADTPRTEDQQCIAEPPGGPGPDLPLHPAWSAGEEVHRDARQGADDEVGEVAEGRLERLSLLRGGALAGRLDGTGPLEPEQWCLVVRGEDDLHVHEAVEDGRQGEQCVVGSVREGQASAGERGVRPGPEGSQQAGAAVVRAPPTDPDDHSLRSLGDSGLEELPDTPRAREAWVALVRGEEVQAGGLAGLHVCRPPASVVHDEHRGGHLATQGVAHGGRDGGAAEGPCEDVEEPGTPVGEGQQLELVVW